jgi:hypothetical protein
MITFEEKLKNSVIIEQGSTAVIFDNKESITIQGEINGENVMYHLSPDHLLLCVKLRSNDNSSRNDLTS